MTYTLPLDAAAGDHRRPALLGYAAIAVAFGGLGLWAALAPLASATVASGQVSIESDRKPIQHLEGGIVREILVKEAERVEEGQVLVRLAPVQAAATLEQLRNQLDDSRAQEARLMAERDGSAAVSLPDELTARTDDARIAGLLADQQRQFTEHRRSADNDVKLQEARIAQAREDIAGKRQQEALLGQQLDSYNAEYNGLEELTRKGFYPRNKLALMARERLRIVAELEGVRTDITRSGAAVTEAQLQIAQIRQHYTEQAVQDLAPVRARMAELGEKLEVANDVMARQDVRAPRAGVVQNIKIHTVGAVLRPGDTVADLVTTGDRLIMTGKVMPSDIQNVQAGQKTEIRFPTLAHEQDRPAYGRLESLSADLITDEATHESYYAARVVLDPATLDPPIARKLVPGMPADLLIVNGERTTLDYILEPIMTRFAKARRER